MYNMENFILIVKCDDSDSAQYTVLGFLYCNAFIRILQSPNRYLYVHKKLNKDFFKYYNAVKINLQSLY